MLWTQNQIVARFAGRRDIALVLPPPTLAVWHRVLLSVDAVIYRFVPAWWWRLPGAGSEAGTCHASILGSSAAQPPTFIDTADTDVLAVATPLIRLVMGVERAVELRRLRTLDSVFGDLARLDGLILGTGADALALLPGAARLVDTLRPILVIDLGNRFGGAAPEIEARSATAALEAIGYHVVPAPLPDGEGRYLFASHCDASSPLPGQLPVAAGVRSVELMADDPVASGWGPRPIHSVELPAGVQRLAFVVGGGHSGDVRLYADLCGRYWFEATAPIDVRRRAIFAVPKPPQGAALARFRLTPVRAGTSGISVRLIAESVEFD